MLSEARQFHILMEKLQAMPKALHQDLAKNRTKIIAKFVRVCSHPTFITCPMPILESKVGSSKKNQNTLNN